ncbi:glucose-6-phosphate isomerase [Pelagibacteraceae bacterium]|nr:glucose-6-phosphate isomerase [Pelagibacteraceae bacterium]
MKKIENIKIKNNFLNLNFKKNNLKKEKSRLNLEKILREIHSKDSIFNILNKRFKYNFSKKNIKKYQKFKTVHIIGMGGSILGAKAIYSFLGHKIKKNFIFIDNLNEHNMNIYKNNKDLKKILFIIISKSGNTIETLTNLNLIEEINFNKKNTIIITENKNNKLKQFAQKYDISIIPHRTNVGGRYSVLSEIGMLPAILMGLNDLKFKNSLPKFFQKSKKKILEESCLKLADIYLSKKISSIILFNYCPHLNDFLFWCQQLIAESLGKKGYGLLPIISPAPKDHHSLLQLYLDGPKDKIFYVFSSNKFIDKKISKVVNAQKKAFIQILKKKNFLFREIDISTFSEDSLGELFIYFILETVLVGKLMGIDPFNQPAVEEVKTLTRKYLY